MIITGDDRVFLLHVSTLLLPWIRGKELTLSGNLKLNMIKSGENTSAYSQ